MTDPSLAPTINEIVYNRPDPAELRDSSGSGRFLVGDIVLFLFGTIIRSGRVTNSIRRGMTQIYNIESDNHVWFRGIEESVIISKLEANE